MTTSSRKVVAVLEQEIAGLGNLARQDLLERWLALYRLPPPKGISRALLIRALAYQLQVKQWGGLESGSARRLRNEPGGSSPASQTAPQPSRPRLQPGARLLREWNGRTHEVEVVEKGFLWRGKPYRSLSAVARAITGARWSGPRFFGLQGSDAS